MLEEGNPITQTASGNGSWPFGVDDADVPIEDDTSYMADDQPVRQNDLGARDGHA